MGLSSRLPTTTKLGRGGRLGAGGAGGTGGGGGSATSAVTTALPDDENAIVGAGSRFFTSGTGSTTALGDLGLDGGRRRGFGARHLDERGAGGAEVDGRCRGPLLPACAGGGLRRRTRRLSWSGRRRGRGLRGAAGERGVVGGALHDVTEARHRVDGAEAVVEQLDGEVTQRTVVTADAAGLLQSRLPLRRLDTERRFLTTFRPQGGDLDEPSHVRRPNPCSRRRDAPRPDLPPY